MISQGKLKSGLVITRTTEKPGRSSESEQPRLQGLTIGGQQRVGGVLLREPFDLVDFFLYLQALQVVKLWLVALEGAVHIVFTLAVGCVLALQGNQKAD